MTGATVHLNKLAAAKRQLQAAIRMFFQREDELAIHTVAAAAHGLLKDIKASRGLSEAADSYLTTFFYLVRDYRRGTLPSHMTTDPAFMTEVKRIAGILTPITADSKLSDVRVTIGPELERQYWNDSNRTANFLKHADRDVDQSLQLDSINNELLLAKCYCAYQDVAPDDLGNEGIVFQAFITTNNESHRLGDGAFDSLVSTMRKVPPERLLDVCHRIILEFNAEESKSAT